MDNIHILEKNLKTINGQSILGEGNIDLEGLITLSSPKVGVEILTEERHSVSGKPIYKKAINFGSLPNATTKSVAHGITGVDFIMIDFSSSFMVVPGVPDTSFSGMVVWGGADNVGAYLSSGNILVYAGNNRTNMNGYFTLKYTKTTDTAQSPVRLIAGAKGDSTYTSWLKEGNVGTFEDFLLSLKGQDGIVIFDDLTPGQRQSLVGPHGPQGTGLTIKYNFSSKTEMYDSLNNPEYTYDDNDLVFVNEEKYLETVLNFDYFISPEGNDITGDGTQENPWKTLKNCSPNSRIGLLPGIYSDMDTDYTPIVAPASDGYAMIHGLFKDMLKGTAVLEDMPVAPEPIKLLHNDWKNLTYNDKFTLLGAVEGKNTAIIKLTNTYYKGRDYPFYSGRQNFIFNNLNIESTRNRGDSYSNAITSWTSSYNAYLNCDIKESRGYSFTYSNSKATLYINGTYTGSRQSSYTSVSVEVSNPMYDALFADTKIEQFITPSEFFIYLQSLNGLVSFIDTARLLPLIGTSGKDGAIRYEDLTPEQREYLKGGPAGPRGKEGKSAYEVYADNVPVGEAILSKVDWLESLKSTNITYTEGESEPTNPKLGDEWHNTTNDILYKRRKKNGILGWYEI